MGTALFTGVTGLQVHQRRLDVVASNIANVNTIGYRGSRVLFQDLFSQTLQGGSAPVGAFGGTNPQQVGLGVQIASIDVNHSQGSLVSTGISSDLAIQGNGFFVLSDGSAQSYSRDGSFTLNANGVLVDPATGLRVQGFLADDTGVIPANAVAEDLVIPVGATGIVRATTQADLIGNLHAETAVGDTVTRTITVFDSLGTERLVDVTFTKSATDNEWTWDAEFDGASVGTGTITFDSSGRLDPTDPTSQPSITIAGATLGAGSGSEPADLVFVLNLSEITQLSTPGDIVSDVSLRNQDGFPRGVLESFNIGGNGEINGVFTNGLTRTIGQVALATFSNVGGLARDGRNLFVETPSSGNAQIGSPGTGGRGTVTGGVLENSNVDLGTEFSNLIITQRGFQANARTITAADTILQETVNLVR
ncbi:MAG: flagellar hook protein FlgE [Candidatus Hydrogenedentes bacterium]|nr:flagellar hook protein FlgE [Candidatus Hydrogenedentota bacterium]MBI3119246.1 flagellar hook protein FlgE [Candidatus Hydrogenedentota bacterium]